MRVNPVKQRLREGKESIGTWLSLASPIAARALVRLDFDWLTLDIEHSPVDWETASTIFGSIADAGGIPLARVPAGRHDHIKRVLDGGGFGVVSPMTMSREEAEACVAAMKYPPVGNRSLGGVMHAMNFAAPPAEYYKRANDEILVVLQCEHIDAVEKADEIFSVEGIDAMFVGPNDLRASMRDASGADPTPDAFEEALSRILAACQRHGIAAGIHCFDASAVEMRLEQGWRFLALGSDISLLMGGAKSGLEALGRSGNSRVANY
ncbi:5-keto-4-deoxy-D-glucarate aldolase [Planctomycetes bacterium Pan216]|uniref:5-keto-4-deoxy-D-glucarate aldolase n=1 Tax=Kolteria novifilia TaxID=2527975 RepID=A0A518B801_9BACT|nr:5-keto-4-deoxy-D-glucarate aldolase [Planctomycetes bacterium Pan216]